MRVAPPVNKTAEASLLGACIKHDGALDSIVDVIEPSAFYTPELPDGTGASLSATISSASSAICYADFTPSYTTGQKGRWTAWLGVVFASGKIGIGEPYSFTMYEVGK